MKKYTVKNYFDVGLRGLNDFLESDNLDDILSFIWESVQHGFIVKVINNKSGITNVVEYDDVVDFCDYVDLIKIVIPN